MEPLMIQDDLLSLGSVLGTILGTRGGVLGCPMSHGARFMAYFKKF